MIPVPLLNPKFALGLAAKCVRTSGSRHWWGTISMFATPMVLIIARAGPARRDRAGADG
jgi:hypothetical protein